MKSKRSLAMPIALSMVASAGNCAVPAKDNVQAIVAPAASIVVMNGGNMQARWYGKGDIVSINRLCVFSSTGRYRMQVSMGAASGPAKPPSFTLVLTTTAGDKSAQSASVGGVFTFEGRTDKTRCSGSSNATLEVHFDQADLTGAVAGPYLTNLQLTVYPA